MPTACITKRCRVANRRIRIHRQRPVSTPRATRSAFRYRASDRTRQSVGPVVSRSRAPHSHREAHHRDDRSEDLLVKGATSRDRGFENRRGTRECGCLRREETSPFAAVRRKARLLVRADGSRNPRSASRAFNEEIFGPVVSVVRFRDESEALEIANDGPTDCRVRSGRAISEGAASRARGRDRGVVGEFEFFGSLLDTVW